MFSKIVKGIVAIFLIATCSNSSISAQVCSDIIYVSTSGLGSVSGSDPSSPTTLTNALSLASSNPNSWIKMATGIYNIDNPMDINFGNFTIEGGYQASSGWRKTSVAGATTINRTTSNPEGITDQTRLVAIYISGSSNFRFQDLTITTANANLLGMSTYGIHLTSCSSYEFVRCQILPGIAGDGANGTNGTLITNTGGAGGSGGNRNQGCNANGQAGSSGSAGSGGSPGGLGGSGAIGDGCNIFGCDANPRDGSNGGNGSDGANGVNASTTPPATNAISTPFFVPNGASASGTAGHGGGGGGGGGGMSRGTDCTCSYFGTGNGGAGGTGGDGGGPGTGGLGGGGSFSLFFVSNGANGNLIDVNLGNNSVPVGGVGGNGATGTPGQTGGSSQNAGCGGNSANSGAGGNGGNGGAGGNGQPGANGVASQIFYTGTAPALFQNGSSISFINGTNGISNFNFVAQPVITVSNSNCTQSNVTYTSSVAGNWDFGVGATPLTSLLVSDNTVYSSLGRKDITYNSDVYRGFNSISFTGVSGLNILSTLTTVPPDTLIVCQGSSGDFSTTATGFIALNWDFGGATTPNTYSGASLANINFPSAGIFTLSLVGTSPCCGTSAPVVKYIKVLSVVTSSFSVTECTSYTVPSGDETYTASGIYMDTIPSSLGCDSVMTINLTIGDAIAPVLDASTLPTLTGQCSVSAPTAPTATDNCSGTITGTTTTTFPIAVQGSTTVVWTFDDGNGNQSTQNQTVTIDDTTPPVPDMATLTTLTGQCSVSAPTAPTATDNCSGTITGTTTTTFPITAQGSTTVVWTFDDGNGNQTTQNQTVTIDDTAPPVPDVTTLTTLTGQCSVSSPIAPTATDNCSGTITGTTTTTFPITAQGSTTVVWTFDDSNGNQSTQNQTVTIDDTTPPVPDMAALTTLTGQCSVSAPTAPTATDNCSGTITGTTTTTFPITVQGSTTVVWTFDDGNGNQSTQNQTVTIDDTTPPVPDMATLTTLTGQCSVSAPTAPTATDNCSGTITGTTTTTFPITAQGSTTIVWTFDDGYGNLTTQDQIVNINDVTDPAAICQNITAYLNSAGSILLSASDIDNGSYDNCSISTFNLNISSLDCSNIGTNSVVLTVEDIAGNQATCNAIVMLLDTVSPNAICQNVNLSLDNSGIATLNVADINNNSYDACGIQSLALDQTSFDCSKIGTNTVVLTVVDQSNNMASCSSNVTVVDDLAPSFTCVTDQNVTTNNTCTYVIEDYRNLITGITDNCSSTNFVISQIPAPGSSVLADQINPDGTEGSSLVTITVEDENGNQETCSFTVNVICFEELFIPGFFSPNGDGKNDLFEINGLLKYPNNEIVIFNRWGNEVFASTNYANDWNGKSSGALTLGNGDLPSGTYYYVINLGDGSAPITGYVELQR
ncbi:MAG: gliding motility-associated C-terminal domain-containing protein [Flavobacteriales bacterium]|nr:gliding motility-associated C-terminal domain-containing protein [Flavobacteriales bacterium]